MTRLKTEWINDIEQNVAIWNDTLKNHLGIDFSEFACRASGTEILKLKTAARSYKVAVVPVTSGEGIISTFAESVASVVRATGFDVFVTNSYDVSGIREAYSKNADVIYMADDDTFVAVNTKNGRIGDNNIATACGYAEVLNVLAGSIAGKAAAVLGYGIVGWLMAEQLRRLGAKVSVYDKNESKKESVVFDGFGWIRTAEELKDFLYIADATNEGGWLTPELLHEKAVIAAPGVPLSLSEEAKREFNGRYVHDMLEIGTACMMGFVV